MGVLPVYICTSRHAPRALSGLLLLIAIVIVAGYVLSRPVLVVVIPVAWWMVPLLFLEAIVVVHLVLDHFINPD